MLLIPHWILLDPVGSYSLNKAIKSMSAKKGKMAASLLADDKDVQHNLLGKKNQRVGQILYNLM